ncbi:ATP-binding cassette domain-containing protein [Rhizobiaceae bacterium n13]|uniref:ATP-binding cassette domain-containing protein n=1 Tax=Ferirhizobium litorale TaxID=2927786 RepID=A0AAE3QET4_9HYPH|nr:ABC-F family ATP-binding cassette domain-containing protein [Fererhizobium litorale]MDI7864714.1 ATP-binding cassette domain-containing protein [Fererhizobium litorale]MDI7922205.1 ATP-binding cassette domain-containing protein [Fererhizobium litorale]
MSSIVLSGLSWTKPDGDQVFQGLDLSFGPERTGLVGRNGVGKTTLLKIIAGVLPPSAGSLSIEGKVVLVRQMLDADPHETVADLFGARQAIELLARAENGTASLEDLVEADWTVRERMLSALVRFGLAADPEMLISRLSGGQRTRAALAAALFKEPDFLLLDEPTNNLDRGGRQAVLDLLGRWRGGAIVISHDRGLLEYMDAIVELTTLGAKRYGGNWSGYEAAKAIELYAAEQSLAHAQKTAEEIDRKAQVLAERQDRRNASGTRKAAKGDMPKILLGRRKSNAEASRGKVAELAERQRIDALDTVASAKARIEVLQPFSVHLPATNLPVGKAVLSLDRVTAGYDHGHPVFRDLSFSIVGPQRTALAGPNGSGKTTLLKMIAGKIVPIIGKVTASVPSAMLDQSVSLLDRNETILANFRRLNPGATENACRATLASFRFRADAALQRVETLSGGQILRAGLACVLGGSTPPSLLILDEPTNHLDIESIETVEAVLRAYDGALLIVSHDDAFLENIEIDRRLDFGGVPLN